MPSYKLFEMWALDFVGPMSSSQGCQYLLTAFEYGSGWALAKPLDRRSQEAVVSLLQEIRTTFGCPRFILTDNGAEFLSDLVDRTCKDLGIKHLRTSPYNPQTNGRVERFNKELQDRMRALLAGNPRQGWVAILDQALDAYRSHPMRPHRLSPHQLLFGTVRRTHLDNFQPSSDDVPNSSQLSSFFEYRTNALHDLAEHRDVAERARQAALEREYTATDESRVAAGFRRGDLVWRVRSSRSKLQPFWDGPFVIYDVSPSGAYQLQTLDGFVLRDLTNQRRLKLVRADRVDRRWQRTRLSEESQPRRRRPLPDAELAIAMLQNPFRNFRYRSSQEQRSL